jgi:uncharacterized protein YjiK
MGRSALMPSLRYSDSWRLPGHELSGLGLRHRAHGDNELLAVSDSSFRVFSGGTDKQAATSRSRKLDDAVAGYTDGDASQWEAIVADRSGRIFVLQEHPGHIFVFDSSLDHLVGAVSLEVPDTGAEWERRWREDDNARGETLVLLEGGCILVIKQKNPVVFVEFGPPGDDAAGGGFLAAGDDFELPDVVELEPRRTWMLDDTAAERLESISDAAMLGDRVHVLSAKSRCIAELQPLPADRRTVGLQREPWPVPDDIEQPEGLVILASTRQPVIAADLKREDPRDNVFLLDPLPA